MTLETNALVGEKYRITGCVGSGGMGLVYAATNEWTGREVVIKTMQADASLERFLREVRATASVKHQYIVDVLDLVKNDSGVYLILERLTGQSMRELLAARGRLTVEAVIDLLLPILDALEFAHGKGLIHRDIKPSNIFLTQVNDRVVPKLLDFGIVSVRDAPALTVAGQFFGTPGYAAPEQMAGGSCTPATDLWAIGVLMFECLTGKLPFGDPGVRGIFAPLTEPPELSLLAGLPERLVKLIASCLRRRESERPASAAEVTTAMYALAELLMPSVGFDATVRASQRLACDPEQSVPLQPRVSAGEALTHGRPSGLLLRWVEKEQRQSLALPLIAITLAFGQGRSLIVGAPIGAPLIAKMRPIGPTFSIEPVGSSQVRRNGRGVTKETALQPGDVLSFESFVLTFDRDRS